MTIRPVLVAVLVLAACQSGKSAGSNGPATHTATAAQLDSLPVVPVTDGRLVCLSDGVKPCPAIAATANWLRGGRFATWEAHKQIDIWTPGEVDPRLLGEVGPGDDKYDLVVSVAQVQTGFVVLSGLGTHALRYTTDGKFQGSVPIPPVSVAHATGYSRDIPFYQLIRETPNDSAAEFLVREVSVPGDTLGRTVLQTPLAWLHLRDGRPTRPLPFFPILPSYAIAPDSDIVWSKGETLSVERRSPAGVLRWSLTTDATGPAVTPEEVNTVRSRMLDPTDAAQRARVDSSVQLTAKAHPAIGALYVADDGRVIVGGVPLPWRDSVTYTMLSNTGAPTARFGMPRESRVLLYAGDSILVQRAGANAQQELRWLMVRPPARP